MRRWLAVLMLLGLGGLLSVGCGAGASEGVGEPCTDGNDCEPRAGVACVVPWPNGYCTEVACTVGSCPTGARCVTGIDFQDVPFDAFCLKTCEQQTECRDGYRCVDVSLPVRVCAPGPI